MVSCGSGVSSLASTVDEAGTPPLEPPGQAELVSPGPWGRLGPDPSPGLRMTTREDPVEGPQEVDRTSERELAGPELAVLHTLDSEGPLEELRMFWVAELSLVDPVLAVPRTSDSVDL